MHPPRVSPGPCGRIASGLHAVTPHIRNTEVCLALLLRSNPVYSHVNLAALTLPQELSFRLLLLTGIIVLIRRSA